MTYQIIPISMELAEKFRLAVGSVAREGKYLSFLDSPSLEMSRDFVAENMREGWPHLVAIMDDKVLGWCDISSLHRPVYAHVGSLGMGVIAEYRGQGIGEQLIRAALQAAKSKGLLRIELDVFAGNAPALKLYRKLGFVVEGTRRQAAQIEGKFCDVIGMALLML